VALSHGLAMLPLRTKLVSPASFFKKNKNRPKMCFFFFSFLLKGHLHLRAAVEYISSTDDVLLLHSTGGLRDLFLFYFYTV